MGFPKDAQQFAVADDSGIKTDEDSLGVAGAARTHFFVCWIYRVARCVANRRCHNAIKLPKDSLGAPKATKSKDCGLAAFEGQHHVAAQNRVGPRDLNCLLVPWEGGGFVYP